MKLSIIQEDIDKGVKNSTDQCPITNAFKRLHPTATRIASQYGNDEVPLSYVRVFEGDQVIRYIGSVKPHEFMIAFDEGEPVQPCEFTYHKVL